MKKVLLFALLFLFGREAMAQSGNIYIINHTDFQVNVTLYAYAPSSCSGGGCGGTYITNIITLYAPASPAFPTGTTYFGPSSPCAIQTGPGWATVYCTTTWCGSLPSDFQWTYASVNLPGGVPCWGSIFPIIVGDAGIGCVGITSASWSTSSGCGVTPNLSVTWSPNRGSALDDVTLTIDQY